MIKHIIFILITFISINIFAQNFDRQKLDSLMTYIESKNQGMGSLSIFHDNKEIYQRSIGFADIDNKIELSPQALLGIGSISKTFTAALIFNLIETGIIDIDQKLSQFYPDIKNAENITVEHLLYHRSGLYNITSSPDYLNWNTKPHTRAELLHKIQQSTPVFEPNEKAEYSNTNFILLSMIAEKVTNKTFQDLLEEKILAPCGCTNTITDHAVANDKLIAFSYGKGITWEKSTVTHSSVPIGAGSIYSTATDVGKFMFCLLNKKIISNEHLDLMMTMKDGFGAGLFTFPFNDKLAYGHTGGIDGFSSMTGFFPSENLCVTYLSNGESLSVNDILIGALSIYFNMPYDFPKFKEAVSITANELDQYIGTYSSESFPMKIMITKENSTLIGQATGQPSFPFKYVGDHTFTFDNAQLEVIFSPEEDQMTLIQGRGTFILKKE